MRARAGVSAALFEGGLRLGRRLGAPSTGPLAGWRRARLAKLFDGGATLRLQYPKEDLGFVYSASGGLLGGIAYRSDLFCHCTGAMLMLRRPREGTSW